MRKSAIACVQWLPTPVQISAGDQVQIKALLAYLRLKFSWHDPNQSFKVFLARPKPMGPLHFIMDYSLYIYIYIYICACIYIYIYIYICTYIYSIYNIIYHTKYIVYIYIYIYILYRVPITLSINWHMVYYIWQIYNVCSVYEFTYFFSISMVYPNLMVETEPHRVNVWQPPWIFRKEFLHFRRDVL